MAKMAGYLGKTLRGKVTNKLTSVEELSDHATLRNYLGRLGIGVKRGEIPGGIDWSDSENRLICTEGVFTGTQAPGSGTYAAAIKDGMTHLFIASHAECASFDLQMKRSKLNKQAKTVYQEVNNGRE